MKKNILLAAVVLAFFGGQVFCAIDPLPAGPRDVRADYFALAEFVTHPHSLKDFQDLLDEQGGEAALYFTPFNQSFFYVFPSRYGSLLENAAYYGNYDILLFLIEKDVRFGRGGAFYNLCSEFSNQNETGTKAFKMLFDQFQLSRQSMKDREKDSRFDFDESFPFVILRAVVMAGDQERLRCLFKFFPNEWGKKCCSLVEEIIKGSVFNYHWHVKFALVMDTVAPALKKEILYYAAGCIMDNFCRPDIPFEDKEAALMSRLEILMRSYPFDDPTQNAQLLWKAHLLKAKVKFPVVPLLIARMKHYACPIDNDFCKQFYGFYPDEMLPVVLSDVTALELSDANYAQEVELYLSSVAPVGDFRCSIS